MATTTSPERQPSAAKKTAPAGQWRTPGRGSAAAPALPTSESIEVVYDVAKPFAKKKKAGRRQKKGLRWDFSFRLRSDGPLHKHSTTMSVRTVGAEAVLKSP